MMWAKTPAAASSIFCAVCIATAAVLPALPPAADRLAKAVSADVSLKVNWGALANFSAVPAYQAAAAGDPTAIFALDSLSGIPAYLTFGLTGNVSAFTPIPDTQAGLAALSGLETYQTALAAGTGDPALLAGIDAFSGVPSLQAIANGDRTGYYGIASTNALQSFDLFNSTGELSSFEPSKTNAGYAALSGLNTYSKANASGNVADLAGIDAFSAIPALQTLGNPASTQADIWAAQRSLASVSAIPEYQDAPVPPPPPPPPVMNLARVATLDSAPVVEDTPPVADKSSNGSYSAKFTPGGPLVLFGTGGGKNAADNGIRGYGDFLKGVQAGVSAALGGAPAPSTPSADASGATP